MGHAGSRIAPGWTCALAALVAVSAAGVPGSGRSALEGPAQDEGQEQTVERRQPADGLVRIDPSMFDLAAASGGDFYFWSRGEFARSQLRIPLTEEPVLLDYSELGPEGRRLSFPVDGLTGRLDVFTGAQRLDEVRLLDPRGRVLDAADPEVELQVFDRMCIATIDRPASGEWRVELEGRGKSCVSVHASVGDGLPFGDPKLAPIELQGFAFVELRGRPGHEGHFPVLGPVVAGERHRFELELCGSFETLELLLISLDGRVLGELSVDHRDPSDDGRWVTCRGECVVPDVPFRALVRGQDATGARYQRVLGSSIRPVVGK